MNNNKGPRLFGALLLITILIIIGIFISRLDTNALMGIKPYTRGMLEKQLEENMVLSASIEQKLNSNGGSVYVTLKDGQEKVLNVTNTNEAEEWIRSYGIDPVVSEVPGENWFISLLPILYRPLHLTQILDPLSFLNDSKPILRKCVISIIKSCKSSCNRANGVCVIA